MFADVTGGTDAAVAADAFAFRVHFEVWLLVALVIAMGVYVVRVIGPKVVPEGEPVISRRQRNWFIAGVFTLWVASDFPLHDLSERYLYSLHMVQHMVLTFVMAPMFWLAMPEWLARLLVPTGGTGYNVLKRLAKPVVAGLLFNGVVAITHWSVIVNTSARIGAFHYVAHLVVVSSALLMWIPVCGPWKELRLSPMGQCIYLFMMSVFPTIPGAWLTLAGAPLYEVYDQPARLWGVSVMDDQSIAGLFMKVAGGAYLWGVIIGIFFRWGLAEERSNRHGPTEPVEAAELETSPDADPVSAPA